MTYKLVNIWILVLEQILKVKKVGNVTPFHVQLHIIYLLFSHLRDLPGSERIQILAQATAVVLHEI